MNHKGVRDRALPGATSLQLHIAGDADGRWCIFEVWRSRGDLNRFISNDLAVAAKQLGRAGPIRPDVVFDVAFQGP